MALLLDCLEQWAKIVNLGEDNKSASGFVKLYVSLQ